MISSLKKRIVIKKGITYGYPTKIRHNLRKLSKSRRLEARRAKVKLPNSILNRILKKRIGI